MNCHFCKEAITPGYQVELHDHNSDDSLNFCRECVNDMFTFFKNEKAEVAKCTEPKGILGLADRFDLVEANEQGHIIKKFKNVMVKDVDMKPHPPAVCHPYYRNYNNYDDDMFRMSSMAEVILKLEIEDPRFLYLTNSQRHRTI